MWMYKDLDPLLNSRLRIAIMAYLLTNSRADFNDLKLQTKATAGNLSVQIRKLEAADYVEVKKGYKENYQQTLVAITPLGITAFEKHVKVLQDCMSKRWDKVELR